MWKGGRLVKMKSDRLSPQYRFSKLGLLMRPVRYDLSYGTLEQGANAILIERYLDAIAA